MKPVIVLPVYSRPHYLARVLASWRNVRGIEGSCMIWRCDPGYPEVVRLLERDRPRCDGEVIVNESRLGNDQNMLAALTAGFATGADFVIAAEDDVLVSSDLLEYMLAMRDACAEDKSVLAVTAWQDAAPGPPDEVQRVAWFFGGACWGIWRDRFDEVRDGWPPSGRGYDRHLWETCQRTGRVCIQPAATRCKNIGETGTGGTWSFRETWERQQFSPDIPPQSYRERAA